MTSRENRGRNGRLVGAVAVGGVLLILPFIALHRRDVNLGWAAGYVVVASLIAYVAYARDKRLAERGEWRISEAQLHFWEILGGWPGAWIAQRLLRHKTSKKSFLFVFWCIVFAYQLAAIDSLQNWKLARFALQFVER